MTFEQFLQAAYPAEANEEQKEAGPDSPSTLPYDKVKVDKVMSLICHKAHTAGAKKVERKDFRSFLK